MSDHEPDPEELRKLGNRIRDARAPKGVRRNKSSPGNIGVAFRFVTELVAGVVVGGLLGWFFDRLFGTSPVLLIVLLFVGAIAGLFNVQRAARELNRKKAPQSGADGKS